MIFKLLEGLTRQNKIIPRSVKRFSVKKTGSVYSVFAHGAGITPRKIGRYKSYTEAKKAVDKIIDLKWGSYGA